MLERPVYIVIVTYNAENFIRACLSSCVGYEVIVVDNASSDETVKIISMEFPDTVLLEMSENLGFGKANNIGIKYALECGCDHVFLLNQDAYLQQGTIPKLMEMQGNFPEYGILSPVHLNGSGMAMDIAFKNYCLQSEDLSVVAEIEGGNPKRELVELPFVNAAAWMISRQALEIVGGFNPLFFMYGEDDDYCHRMQYHGFKIGVVTRVFIRHDREHRRVETPEPFSEGYFENRMRRHLIRFANPLNSHWKKDFVTFQKKHFKKALKGLAAFKFKMFAFQLKEVLLCRTAYRKAGQSRVKVMKRDTHFLA